MRYAGSQPLGGRVHLGVACAAGQTAAAPDAAPVAVVRNSAGSVVASYTLPPADPAVARGLFARAVHLDRRYAVGTYTAEVSYAVGGAPRLDALAFEVTAGGHPDGAVVAGFHYHRPHAEFQVLQLDSGKLFKGRNPYL